MQKKIIALAVAGLASTAAFAQTNVTVYGVVDAALTYVNTNGGTRTNAVAAPGVAPTSANGRDAFSIQSGQLAGSRLGFRGTEDLGNGLKAIFALEYALNIDQNTGVGAQSVANGTGAAVTSSTLQARQQYVGLSTKAGDITLGRLYAPGFYLAGMDALVTSPALSVKFQAQTAAGASIDGSSASRWNNAVSYKTANFGGFSGHAVYSMGEVTNELAQGENYGIGADYAAGPVAVKYVFQHATNNAGGTLTMGVPSGATAGTLTGTQNEHYVGASFDMKVVKLMGSAQVLDKGGRANAGGQAAQSAVYTIGAVVPVGKGNIHASYAYADLNSSTVGNASSGYNGDYNGVAVAYTHGLSKRTTAYTGLRYQDRDTKGTTLNGVGSAVTTVFGAGINHTF